MKPNIQSGFTAMKRRSSAHHAKWLAAMLLICVGAAVILLRDSLPDEDQPATIQTSARESGDFIGPNESLIRLDPRKVELGGKLFHDPRLSHNNTISCSSCHNLEAGGTDGRAFSIGINGTVGQVTSLTVLNAGFNFRQFWDGHAETLEQQIDGPILSPVEMGSTWKEVVEKLQASSDYAQAYRQIYGSPIQPEGIKELIADFERSLAKQNSRFDQFLRGDTAALTAREQQGYGLFRMLGCVSCHQGAGIGGNMYQKVGIMAPYFEDRGHPTQADLGRFNVTGDEQDKYVFKVPSLRNVALTAPYFHDGQAKTLPDAIRMMGKYQLGRQLSKAETELLAEFLQTLTGKLNGKPL
jgi:cytochrome c peroxidase